jgi:4-amino-4-deoxy-L-arabinose transferase-like glycosyltransferase
MRMALIALAALTALRLVLAFYIPLAPDETYYFTWAAHLQSGFYDHPPMVALFIKLGTLLFGPTALGIRATGPVVAIIGSVLVYDAAQRLSGSRATGLIAASLLNATLLIGVGVIVMTPDTPLMIFWTLGLWALIRLVTGGGEGWWLVVGVVMGAALFSKYTGALFIIAVLLWLLTSPQGRARLNRPGPWVAALIALGLFTPVLYWNAAHHWISFGKQGSRSTHFNLLWAMGNFVQLCLSQFFLVTPIIFVLAATGLKNLRRLPGEGPRLLLWLTVVPGVVFIEHCASERVQGNWVAVLYPTICIAVALLPAATLQRWLKPALAFGFGLTALTYVQAGWALLPLPVGLDPTAHQLAGWQNFVARATAAHPAYITSDDYWATVELAFYGPKDVPVYGDLDDHRWRYFDWPRSTKAQAGLVGLELTRRPESPCPVLLGTLSRQRGDGVISTYRLCRVVLQPGQVVLPRPDADGR